MCLCIVYFSFCFFVLLFLKFLCTSSTSHYEMMTCVVTCICSVVFDVIREAAAAVTVHRCRRPFICPRIHSRRQQLRQRCHRCCQRIHSATLHSRHCTVRRRPLWCRHSMDCQALSFHHRHHRQQRQPTSHHWTASRRHSLTLYNFSAHSLSTCHLLSAGSTSARPARVTGEPNIYCYQPAELTGLLPKTGKVGEFYQVTERSSGKLENLF